MRNSINDYLYLFEDAISEISDNIIINELKHTDTFLTKPFKYMKNEKIKLYHFSNAKLSKITPRGVNVGNKLNRKIQKSIWWTEHKDEWTLPIQSFLKYNYRPDWGLEVFWDAKNIGRRKPNEDGTISIGVLMSKEFYDRNKHELEKFKSYRYEKTFNIRDVGRGTEPSVPEWTSEEEVSPDKVDECTFNDLIKNKTIIITNRETVKDAVDYHSELSRSKKSSIVFPYMINYNVEWWKYNEEKYHRIRKDAEKEMNAASYKELHSNTKLTENED